MIKILLALSTLSMITIAQAAYTITIPLEQEKGGPLQNGSINISPTTPSQPTEKWISVEPTYGSWSNQGNIYGCSNWTPATSSNFKDESFNQTSTDCKQDQIRTQQNREQETTTLAYRDVGAPIEMKNSIVATMNRTALGTASCLYSKFTEGSPDFFWMVGVVDNVFLVKLNNQIAYNGAGRTTTSITYNGTVYKRGNTIKDTSLNYLGNPEYYFYEICK